MGLGDTGWVAALAGVLPVPRRAAAPFALGETVEEVRLSAGHARRDAWTKDNRRSLAADVEHLVGSLGPRVSAMLGDQARDLVRGELLCLSPSELGGLADKWLTRWRSEEAVRAAFRDLCDAARAAGATEPTLRPLADIVASQLGAESLSSFSVLRDAAGVLRGRRSVFEVDDEAFPPISQRLHEAEELLAAGPRSGDIVVWLSYRRASGWGPMDLGPMRVLPAAWHLPNASQDDGQAFPERDELRLVLQESFGFASLVEEVEDPESSVVLVRVELGQRTAAGAIDHAQRMVEALVGVAVGSGGISWQSAETSAVLMDGRVVSAPSGVGVGRWPPIRDWYGMDATVEVLELVSHRMASALRVRPMPEYLIEAIMAVREAGMTDHRDVESAGERAVTPRVAVALEDHAVELVASIGEMLPAPLLDVLWAREAERRFRDRILSGDRFAVRPAA